MCIFVQLYTFSCPKRPTSLQLWNWTESPKFFSRYQNFQQGAYQVPDCVFQYLERSWKKSLTSSNFCDKIRTIIVPLYIQGGGGEVCTALTAVHFERQVLRIRYCKYSIHDFYCLCRFTFNFLTWLLYKTLKMQCCYDLTWVSVLILAGTLLHFQKNYCVKNQSQWAISQSWRGGGRNVSRRFPPTPDRRPCKHRSMQKDAVREH